MSNRPLTDKELEDIVNNMSDIEYESDIDDSVDSTDSEMDAEKAAKRQKLMGSCVQTNIGPADIPLESETLSDNDESSSDQSDNNRGVGEVGSHEVQVIWNDCTGNLEEFQFSDNPGFSTTFFAKRSGDEPLHFYKLLLEDTIPIIVQQTNLYAEERIISCIANETIKKNSLLTYWKDTDESEILAFIGMLIWMGLNKKPTLKDYFSRNILYKNEVGKYIGMSRMRFELLLSNLHFSNNETVTDAKLEKGAMIARESNTHVVVGKWKDKREVLFLTTEAVPKITDVQTKRGAVKKPSTIAKYNSIKSFIDVSDQKASYSTAVRRGIKWYRKVAIELLTNTAPVNAHIAYQSVTKKTINITKFREEITNKIFNDRHNAVNIPSEEASRNHKFIETKSRGRCTRCYKVNSDRNGRGYAMKNTPRTKMHCQGREDKFLCIKCFFDTHNCSLRK
nr:unnamed protein product [Callosobruchus analis]